MPANECANGTIAALHLNQHSSTSKWMGIREGDCLSIGSDSTADIYLSDDKVSSIHCIIMAKGGMVTLRDCFSETGTFVNDIRIREIQIDRDSTIRAGSTAMLLNLNCTSPRELGGLNTSGSDSTTHPAAKGPVLDVESCESESIFTRESDMTSTTSGDLEFLLQQAHAEIEVLQSRLTTGTNVVTGDNDPYRDEMIELLRSEILDLQTSLADHHLNTTKEQSVNAGASDIGAEISKVEAEKLVERLEQLLLELQQRDDQIATLTELLESTEEASQAEREERDQIDSWLRDIEERFGDREKEWRLQREKLQTELEGMIAERDRAEAALNADTSIAKLEAAQKITVGLRDTAESRRRQICELEQTIAELQRELELARRSPPREELVRFAEERSEIARQRQELDALRQKNQHSGLNEDNLKFHALRQHLNEIHEKERKEQEERKLSSRISKLWRRLEGR